MAVLAPVITVDGPGGAGKGTLCQALAETFGWNLLDSGAIYRVLALAVDKHRIDINDEISLIQLASQLDVNFLSQEGSVIIILEGSDVTHDIRNENVAAIASKVAVIPSVRATLLQRQRDFRQSPGLIADGRDMGTVVFPDAPVKIFLDASAEVRTRRRMLQLQEKGNSVKFEHLLSEIIERDQRDRNRAVAPLVPAENALVIDSSAMTIEEVIEKAVTFSQEKLGTTGI